MSIIIFCIALTAANLWLSFAYHTLAVGSTTPILERKVREHRVSKQVLQMVRDKEKELASITELDTAKKNLEVARK